SFEIEPPSSGEMSSRIAKVQAFAPWLVCTSEPEVVGYACATKHRERAAYQWSVEVSAYVRDGCRGSGIGAALYTSLFELLRLQGFCNAQVADVAASVERAGALGGRVLMHSKDDAGHSQWAVLMDPNGA